MAAPQPLATVSRRHGVMATTEVNGEAGDREGREALTAIVEMDTHRGWQTDRTTPPPNGHFEILLDFPPNADRRG